ncbi:MAG TPA: hypothetical protein VGG91_21540 [Myxococcaceae bacterium]|jgi:hypothetical protein
MSDRLDARWKRLVAAARQAPAVEPRPSRPTFVERVARTALLARTTASPRAPERLAWAGLLAVAALGAAVVLVWPDPVAATVEALSAGAGALPRSVPHAPVAPRPPLPSREAAFAAVLRLPELGLELPFPQRRTDTP